MLNPKGGSGKTTLATNLAAYYASRGHRTALMDCDPQASSTRWLKNRSDELSQVHGVEAYRVNMQATRSWQLRTPPNTQYLVVDTSAAIPAHNLVEFTRGADSIVIPVGPSDIDIHAAAGFIANLLLVAKEDRREGRLGVIANRVREGTLAYARLMRFLHRLNIPVIAILRDTQNYVHAAEEGMGIHEFKHYRVRKDIAQWTPLLRWLQSRIVTPLDEQAVMPNADQTIRERADQAPLPAASSS
ncbi:MAG: ParA family protein [Gammaproteobacteria bacterium]